MRLAHNLKGTARTLGAAVLGELAAGVEQTARDGQPVPQQGRCAALAALEEELERVLTGLGRLDATAPPLLPSRGNGWRDSLFQDLARLLLDHDTAAVERVAGLQQAMAGSAHATAAGEIGRAIACYDVARAHAGLCALARSLGIAGDWKAP